jgi:cytidylate kinase
MKENFVITISHELGCGGAYIGKKLSELLSIPFVDRQILKMVADYLNIPEEDIEGREERTVSFWESFMHLEAFSDPITAAGTEYFPSDKELFSLESEFIEQIASKGSAIILGRGGRYILRNYPAHFSVFVHSNMENRIHRTADQRGISINESKKLILANDKERNAYMKTFIKLDWLDLRNYDLCINTSSIGLDKSTEIIGDSIKRKFSIH